MDLSKFFGVKCNKNGIKILNKNFSYEKLFNLSLEELIKKSIKDNKKNKKMMKNLNIKVDMAKFNLKIGVQDMFITVFAVTIFSGIIAEILKNKMKKITSKSVQYKVIPEFNKLGFFYDGKTDISVKTFLLFLSLLKSKPKRAV